MKPDLLSFTSKGIYCAAADVYLDPWRPVDKAIISHAHADHSRYGNKKYIAHHHSVPVIKHRLGGVNIQGISWNEPFSVNGVQFTLYPAGHIVGSSLIKVMHKGEIALFTGDYKLENDGLSTPLEMQRCHTLITECTFGLPIFRWKPQQEVFSDIENWWSFNQQNSFTSVIYAYSLGKAQRLLHNLQPTYGPILVHPAIAAVNESLSPIVSFGDVKTLTADINPIDYPGALLILPPSGREAKYLKKWGELRTASASGWMATRGNRRRRNVDRGFVISDHCDFDALNTCIKYSEAEKVICTHGFTDIYSKYLRGIGFNAGTEHAEFEEEEIENSTDLLAQ